MTSRAPHLRDRLYHRSSDLLAAASLSPHPATASRQHVRPGGEPSSHRHTLVAETLPVRPFVNQPNHSGPSRTKKLQFSYKTQDHSHHRKQNVSDIESDVTLGDQSTNQTRTP
jgi:hypothetical protein